MHYIIKKKAHLFLDVLNRIPKEALDAFSLNFANIKEKPDITTFNEI